MTATSPDEDTPPSTRDQLWRIGDVATFLTLCENSARDVIDRENDTPRPILECGKVRLWHADQWTAWARRRAGLDSTPVPADGLPAGERWEEA